MWLLWTRKLHYYSVLVIKINWSLLIDYSKLIFVSCFANKIYLRWGTRNQPISFLSNSIVWLCVLLFIEKMQFHPIELSTWDFNHRHFSYFKHSKLKLISFRQFADKGLKSRIVSTTMKEKERIYRNTASFDVYLQKNFPQEIEEAYLRSLTKNFSRLVWAM